MKSPHLLIMFLALGLTFTTTTTHALETGRAAPQFSISSSTGGQLALEEFRGEVVLLDIWASWCGTCKSSLPWLTELQARYKSQGLKIVTVSVDENRKDADAFIAAAKSNLLVGYDPAGSIPEAYGVTSMPSSFLIDREGKVLAIHEGLSEKVKRSIEEEIVRQLKT